MSAKGRSLHGLALFLPSLSASLSELKLKVANANDITRLSG
jgi:hypothetical protein